MQPSEEWIRQATREDILARVRSAGAEARPFLALADELAVEDPQRALTLLEGLSKLRELSREASARTSLLALTRPAEHALHGALHRKVQPELLGRTFQEARGEGAGATFAEVLAQGLLEPGSSERLVRVVVSLAGGGLEARKLAGAILAACPPGIATEQLGELILWLSFDPLPEVWSHGAAAWGHHASAVPWLAKRLMKAMGGEAVIAEAAEPREDTTHVSDAPTVLVQARSSKKAAVRAGSVLPRRALAAYGAWFEAAPDLELEVGGAKPRTASEAFEGALFSDAVDVWDRASAAFGLLAFHDLAPFVETLERRARREALPVLANLAFVLAQRRPSGSARLARAVLAGLERVRATEDLGDWLDAVLHVHESLSDDDTGLEEQWRQLTSGVPGFAQYLRLRAALAGRGGAGATGEALEAPQGPLRALALSDLLAEAHRLGAAWRHVEAAAADSDAALALEQRISRLARTAAVVTGATEGAPLEAALSAGLVDALARILGEIPPLLVSSASPADRRQLGLRTWVLTRTLRAPAVVDPSSLEGTLVEVGQSVTPTAVLRRVLDWTGAHVGTGDRHPGLHLLRVAADMAASRPDLTQLAIKRLPLLLRVPITLDDERARPVQRGLARLSALALDVAEIEGASPGPAAAALRELSSAIAEHPFARSGLMAQLRERLRSRRGRLLLDEAAYASSFTQQKRQDIMNALAAGPSADPPGTIDGFVIEKLLGRGGFGAVYRCTSERHGVAAVKVCHDLELARGRDFQRFLDEAVLISRLDHPAIPRLLAIGHHCGYPYIAMEFVEGVTLAERIAVQGLSRPDRWRILLDLVTTLQYAHSRDVVHRDLKPGNLFMAADGTLRVIDWGLAHSGRVTPGAIGALGGTRLYSAPEQFTAGRAGSEALVDYFAFGRIGMEVLAGKPLMELLGGDLAHESVHPALREEALLEAGIPKDAVELLTALAHPDPRQRATSLDPFAHACKAAIERG